MKKITNDTYPIELYVLPVEESNTINEIFGEEDMRNPIEEFGVGAYCCTDQKGKIVIVVGEDIVALAHECVHATSFAFKLIGAKVDVNNDEPYAYLFSWFYENALLESGLAVCEYEEED